MAIYKLENKIISKLKETNFTIEKINERSELQQYLISSINIIEEGLLVIANEFSDWEDSRRSIDILCIDKKANLVVIELKKTEDGGHMELQAIRYAAMISTMTFAKTVSTYKKHIEKHKLNIKDAEDDILDFLGWESIHEDEFGQDIRIILISADFSKEITTSVLWLNERELDIKCIRIKPQKDEDRLYLDIQQIIPLPEANDYQIKFKEKVAEERQLRRTNCSRDFSKYDISINGVQEIGMNKRKAMFFVISHALKSGIKPEELFEITHPKRWIWVNKICNDKKDFESQKICNINRYDPSRWFIENEELFKIGNKTYAFSNQHSKEAFGIITNIFTKFQSLNGSIKISE